MADMQFDLVSPERSLASFPANAVQIPGADGDMTVMEGHAPTITTLRPGVMQVEAGGQTHEFVVTGGFAEIAPTGISVLAEKAVARAEMTQEQMDEMFESAQAALARAKEAGGASDEAAKLLADVGAVCNALGLSAKVPAA